jgi:hypothetical protein
LCSENGSKKHIQKAYQSRLFLFFHFLGLWCIIGGCLQAAGQTLLGNTHSAQSAACTTRSQTHRTQGQMRRCKPAALVHANNQDEREAEGVSPGQHFGPEKSRRRTDNRFDQLGSFFLTLVFRARPLLFACAFGPRRPDFCAFRCIELPVTYLFERPI